MIRKVIIAGSGSAGLIAALAIKKRNPNLSVRVLSSERIGTIGVGEGTVPFVLNFMHRYLGLDEAEAYRELDPVYKLGVRFTWGKRDYYDYTFSTHQHQLNVPGETKRSGAFVLGNSTNFDLSSAMMDQNKVLPKRGDGLPNLPPAGDLVAWHLENHKFIAWLENQAKKLKIEFIEGKFTEVSLNEQGEVKGLQLETGALLKADFFVDASGFRSELVHKALETPHVSYAESLLCRRALVGGWDRGDEPILPYTTSDGMNAGWAWRIDHPERINRGYVYCPDHISDDEAEREFRARNPKLGEVREVNFSSGRVKDVWVKNVVAIGNAAGFVEPLEATAIMCACLQAKWLADGLVEAERSPTPSMRTLYNRQVKELWNEIKDFLALHYKFNNRVDNEFWKRCREEIDLGQLNQLAEFYRENGPTPLGSVLVPERSPFGYVGYLSHLVGLKVKSPSPKKDAKRHWDKINTHFSALADRGIDMAQVREKLLKAESWGKIRKPA
jgi:tryptophan halogenase